MLQNVSPLAKFCDADHLLLRREFSKQDDDIFVRLNVFEGTFNCIAFSLQFPVFRMNIQYLFYKSCKVWEIPLVS